MSDVSDLLSACIASPGDRSARLVYADALQESGDAARAEFVRVQCELAQRGSPAPNDDRTHHLAVHERELLAAHEATWRNGPKCDGPCNGHGYYLPAGRDYGGAVSPFETCYVCWGSGDAGGLTREFAYHGPMTGVEGTEHEPVRIVWSAYPLLTVTVRRLSDLVVPRDTRYLEYIPTAWLAAVVRHHPGVVSVLPLDREPYPLLVQDRCFWAHPGVPGDGEHCRIPGPVFRLLNGYRNGDQHPYRVRWYDTRAAAVGALGAALVRFCKDSS